MIMSMRSRGRKEILGNFNQKEWNVQGATPVLKGKATLDGGEWQAVTDEDKAEVRFVKVEIVLP